MRPERFVVSAQSRVFFEPLAPGTTRNCGATVKDPRLFLRAVLWKVPGSGLLENHERRPTWCRERQWAGSNHHVMPNGFYSIMTRLRFFSELAVPNFPPFPIATPDRMLLLSGVMFRMKLLPDKFACFEKIRLSSIT